MAGIPGMFVARVPSGAKVITVIGSRMPVEPPGSTPHPARDAPTAPVHRARAVAVLKGRGREKRRLPVMSLHNSAPWVTPEWWGFNTG
ncbi:hypothetical protein SSP531S_46660 [Streptomyces spongiicola]|uniref:Uncharacterized protein n=1 Tax=Streptomyces spongiicola TaxID=1690221 RepID=A0A388T3T4_9ACTN|nr:hypothetical protein SSP531S_46660 [Streptomyces spongiicola]